MLHEMLTGHPPFAPRTLDELQQIAGNAMPSISLAHKVPRLLEEFICELAAPRPDLRMTTAAQALQQLRRLLEVFEFLSRPPLSQIGAEAVTPFLQPNALGGQPPRRQPTIANAVQPSQPSRSLDPTLRSPGTASTRHAIPGVGAGDLDTPHFGRRIAVSMASFDVPTFSGGPSPDALPTPPAPAPPPLPAGLSRETTAIPPPSALPRAAARPHVITLRVPQETPKEPVDFSVYAPYPVQAGSSFLLNVWACLPEQRAEMLERAAGPSRKVEVGSRGGILLPGQTPLFLRLRLDRFDLDNPMEPFAWHGQVTNITFLVSAPGHLVSGTYPGEVQLLDCGILLGKFYFEIQVAPAQAAAPLPPASQAELRSEWVRSAFASYASRDRERVVQRVQGITAAGIEVFLDVASLRTGSEWQQQLFRAIETRDIFYLFWSRFAKASEHVEREWRTALEKKGLAFIHPIPLEDPRHALPPDELSSLHFNDIYLAILKTSVPPDPGDSAPIGPP
jgi:hypothetical protein